jgi:hypothetical protein
MGQLYSGANVGRSKTEPCSCCIKEMGRKENGKVPFVKGFSRLLLRVFSLPMKGRFLFCRPKDKVFYRLLTHYKVLP